MSEEWKDRGACLGEDQEIFFPDSRQSAKALLPVAREICATCPVFDECLDHTLNAPRNEHGTWAGLDERTRAQIRGALPRKRGQLIDLHLATMRGLA